jgi:2-phospho-L-lactate guanylyltransferase (CobY/MobA/RfbA family)
VLRGRGSPNPAPGLSGNSSDRKKLGPRRALATLPAAHRWGGTAVALIESTTAHLWHVFKGADAVLSMMEAKRTGCEVLISYSFSLGAWVEQETLFDDAA